MWFDIPWRDRIITGIKSTANDQVRNTLLLNNKNFKHQTRAQITTYPFLAEI